MWPGWGSELLIVTNNPAAYAYLNLPLVGDVLPDKGPLGGIYTALRAASQPHVLVVACDMPWLNRELLAHLHCAAQQRPISSCRAGTSSRNHCTPSTARPAWNPSSAILPAGNLKITRFFGEVELRFVDREEIEWFDKARPFLHQHQLPRRPGTSKRKSPIARAALWGQEKLVRRTMPEAGSGRFSFPERSARRAACFASTWRWSSGRRHRAPG